MHIVSLIYAQKIKGRINCLTDSWELPNQREPLIHLIPCGEMTDSCALAGLETSKRADSDIDRAVRSTKDHHLIYNSSEYCSMFDIDQ